MYCIADRADEARSLGGSPIGREFSGHRQVVGFSLLAVRELCSLQTDSKFYL